MEDFQKRLYKEYFELKLRTVKNEVFIWTHPKFKELDIALQKAQLKQYFAQEAYVEALYCRVRKLGDYSAFMNGFATIFEEKFKGKSIQHIVKCRSLHNDESETETPYKSSYLKDIYCFPRFSCSRNSFEIYGSKNNYMLVEDVVAYGLIIDGKIDLLYESYEIKEPTDELVGFECGGYVCESLYTAIPNSVSDGKEKGDKHPNGCDA